MGKSWGPLLAGRAERAAHRIRTIGWEIFGNRAVRQGQWKIRWEHKPLGKGDWELFNLAADPASARTWAKERSDKLKAMLSRCGTTTFARTTSCCRPLGVRVMEDQMPPRVPDDPGYPPLTTSASSCRQPTCWPSP